MVGWLDVFTRNEYKDLIVESLAFCQEKKGIEIHAWCIMSSHVHLVFRSVESQNPELLLGDLKRFTSRSIVKCIQENPAPQSLPLRKVSRLCGNKPVEAGYVFRPEDYKYSSASDYAGQKGILNNVVVFQYFKV